MNSPIKWPGGKRLLRKQIIKLIPEHHCYIEPFFGGGWVFFGKNVSKVEVINDRDGNLINFYNAIKNNFNEFLEKLEVYLISRDEFEYLRDNDFNDDILKAYQFYYLNKLSFGGNRRSFGSYYRDKPYLNKSSLDLLKKCHKRLQGVWIENMDAIAVLEKFGKKDSFAYLDPPYYNTNNNNYAVSCRSINFEELSKYLEKFKGKFLMSINKSPYIEEVFSNFSITDVDVFYSICKQVDGRGKYKELLISNYDLEGSNIEII